jgi:WD40 repeat protein
VLACLATSVLPLAAACEPADVRTVDVDVDIVGNGAVFSAPEGIDCDDSCDADFAEGTHVTLQARAGTGAAFLAWEGDCQGASDFVDLVVEDDVACSARFVDEDEIVDEIDPTLTLEVIGPGSVSASGGITALACGADDTCSARFARDALVTIDAIADAGAELVGFSGDCAELFFGSAEVVMDADRTCTVSFFAIEDVSYPFRVMLEGHGRVTSSPAGLDCDEVDQDCEARFAHGTFVTVTATPDAGWTFLEWGHTCQDVGFGETIDIEMLFSIACSAIFERQLVVTVSGSGRVDSTTDPPMSCDSVCSFALTEEGIELVATPDPGHRFVGWAGACAGTSTTTIVPENASACTASFEQIPPTLTVDIQGGGTVATTDGAIDCPSQCSAELASGNIFDPGEWTCSSTFFGTGDGCDCGCGVPDPDCASSLASACAFTEACAGHPVVEDRNHLCYSNDGGATSVTLVATAADGFVFSSWQDGCTGTSPTLFIIVDASITCRAVFVAAIESSVVRTSPRIPQSPVELAVSGDGARVAVVGDSVVVFDAVTARPLRRIETFEAATRALLDVDGLRVALAYDSDEIEVFEGDDSVILFGHTSAPTALAFAAPAAAIGFASGDAGGRVKLWSTSTGLVQRTLVPHAASVRGLAFLNDGVVVSAASDGTIATTTTGGVAVDALQIVAGTVDAAVSCAATTCAVGAVDGVHVVHIDAAGILTAGPVHAMGGSIADLDLLDGGRALVTFASGAGRVVDLITGALTPLVDEDAILGAGAVGPGLPTRAFLVGDTLEIFSGVARTHALTSVPWDRIDLMGGRRVVATASFAPVLFFEDGGVRAFASAGTASALARGASGVYVAGGGGVVRVNASDGTRSDVLTGLSPGLHGFALNAAEDRLAGVADSFNDDVVVYELPVGDPFRTLTGHLGRVHDVAFAEDNVVTAGNDGDVRVFAVSTGTLVGAARFASGAVPRMLDANANGAIAGAVGGELIVLDVTDGAATAELDLDCSLIDVALAFDGSLAAACCADRIVIIDIGLGAPRGEIAGAFSSLRFAPDELLLLAVDDAGWTTFALAP